MTVHSAAARRGAAISRGGRSASCALLLVAPRCSADRRRIRPTPSSALLDSQLNGLVAYDDSGDIYARRTPSPATAAGHRHRSRDRTSVQSGRATARTSSSSGSSRTRIPDLGQLCIVERRRVLAKQADHFRRRSRSFDPTASVRVLTGWPQRAHRRREVAGPLERWLVAAADGSGEYGPSTWECMPTKRHTGHPAATTSCSSGATQSKPAGIIVNPERGRLRPSAARGSVGCEPTSPRRSECPDGSRVADSAWATNVPYWTVHTVLVDADGGNGRDLAARGPASWESSAVWSNSGTQLAVCRGYTLVGEGQPMFAAVIQADGGNGGSQTEVPVGRGASAA